MVSERGLHDSFGPNHYGDSAEDMRHGYEAIKAVGWVNWRDAAAYLFWGLEIDVGSICVQLSIVSQVYGKGSSIIEVSHN